MIPVRVSQIFNPRSIAIIGASADAGKFAGKVTANALRSAGRSEREVYLVNPKRSEILGHRVYPSIADIGAPVDQAYIVVPALAVVGQLRAADQAGIGLATIFSGGFGEAGHGTAELAGLTAALDQLRIRAIGPNCNGVINVFDSLAVTSSSVPYLELIPGPIAVISHSGALGQVNGLQRACARGIGIGYQLSCGNAIDFGEVDLIEQAFADPRITVVVAILERITDGARLLGVAAAALAEGKLLVVVKLGQSAAGKSAILGHTGEAAGHDGVARRLLGDAGVLVVEDIDHALECADLWAKSPGIAGGRGRVASVSLSGGNLAYFVDACAVRGIAHPELPAPVRARLAAVLPPMAVTSNPVDLSSFADVARDQSAGPPASLLPAVLSILSPAGLDALVVILTLPPDSDLRALLTPAGPGTGTGAGAAPVIVIWAGDSREGTISVADLRQAGLTVFENAISCAQALRNLRGPGRPDEEASPVTDRAWPLEEARRQLQDAGLRFPAGAIAASEDAARAAAGRLGYPVAVKSAVTGLVHKAAAGGVMLDLGDQQQVAAAYQGVTEAARRLGLEDAERVLVERMTPARRALFLSVVADDSFGPVVLLGDAKSLDGELTGLSVAALDRVDLAGFVRSVTGDEAADAVLAAVESVRKVAAQPDVELVEINPLFVQEASAVAVDCVVIVRGRS